MPEKVRRNGQPSQAPLLISRNRGRNRVPPSYCDSFLQRAWKLLSAARACSLRPLRQCSMFALYSLSHELQLVFASAVENSHVPTPAVGDRLSWDWIAYKNERGMGNQKGRDIGYALAASSCEGANSVEHAPSQPFDAITAFAVPDPNYSSQSCRFFRVWLPFRSLRWANHPIYFGLANFI
jgi:hypothetical protein